jgi:hypothetical protein
VVDRHLAGLEADPDRLAPCRLDRDLLAARQQVVAMKGVEVRKLVDRVRARMNCM